MSGFSLGKELEEQLRFILYQYILLKQEKKDATSLVHSLNIKCRIETYRDYCRKNAVFIIVIMMQKNKISSMIVGDICIYINFENESISSHYNFENWKVSFVMPQ